MRDPSSVDPLLRALAYAHPAWMLVGLLLAGAALRSGLALRRARRGGHFDVDERGRHLRRAKWALAWIALGFLSGPLSMHFLRGRDLFESAHAVVAVAALFLFAAAGFLGRRLERGEPASRELHALLAVLAVLGTGLAFATGWVLLP